MADEILRALYRLAMDDIVLVRKFPPDGGHTPTYFGGLPRLPTTLDWPVSACGGHHVSFIAQIDLGSLPPMQWRSRLPLEGTLFFFVDTTFKGKWEEGCHVLFAPHSCVTTPEREAPDDLPPIFGELAHHHVEWLLGDRGLFSAPRLFPYWPIEPMIIRTFAEEPRQRPADPPIDEIRAARDKEERRILDAAFGKSERRHILGKYFVNPEGSKHPGQGFLPPPGYPLKPFIVGEAWLPDETWPYSWVFAAILCTKILQNRNYGILNYQQIEEQAQAWRHAAQEAGLFSSIPEKARAAFRAWVQSIRLQLPAYFGRKPDDPPSPIFASWIAETITSGAEACLGYAGAIKGLFPEYLLPLIRWKHHPYVTNTFELRHQLLGAPRSVQSAIDDYGTTHMLLAQFDYDEGCRWYWGDAGVIQFWITPQDLAELRFDRAVLTLESS